MKIIPLSFADMKRCPSCNQTYSDESLNFCLADGTTLIKVSDDAPPTIFMNQPRVTNPTNLGGNNPFSTPGSQPISRWQNPHMTQNPPYMAANQFQSQNQTLAVVSLVLGIAGNVFCCYGFPFGIAALITGFIGYNNANSDPNRYSGSGMAIAGMILGAISIFMLLIFVIIGAAS